MLNRRICRWLTAASVTGAVTLAPLALTGVAHADTKQGTDAPKGCTYAGQSYSNGSTRQQEKKFSNGTSVYENYECKDGSWVYTGTTMVNPSSHHGVSLPVGGAASVNR